MGFLGANAPSPPSTAMPKRRCGQSHLALPTGAADESCAANRGALGPRGDSRLQSFRHSFIGRLFFRAALYCEP